MLAQLKVKLASAEADVAELRAKVIKAELAEAEAEAVALRERLSLALEAAPSSRGTHHAAPPPASRHLSTQDAALTHVMRTANASWCSRTLPRGQTHTYNQKWWLAPLLREAEELFWASMPDDVENELEDLHVVRVSARSVSPCSSVARCVYRF